MDYLGTDFNTSGSVMSRSNLEELRKKRGECVTCGRKCFKKKLFKMVPLDEHGRVLNGRCLNCHPLDLKDGSDLPAVSRPATKADLTKFSKSQQQLSSRNLMPPGTASAASSQSSRRVAHSTRAMSAFPARQTAASSSSASNSARPPMGSRSQSMMPATLTSLGDTPPRATSLVPISAESQPSAVPPQPSRAASALNGNSGHSIRSQDEFLANPTSSRQFSSRSDEFLPAPPASSRQFSSRSQDEFLTPRDPSRQFSSRSASTRSGQSSRSMDSVLSSNGVLDSKPTPEEMQQATMILSAAKKHGVIMHPGEMPGLDEHLEQFNSGDNCQLNESYEEYEDLAGESRERELDTSLRSISTHGDPPSEIDGFEIPQHGILNRGGAFPVSPPPRIRPKVVQPEGQYTSSNRTLSSMSSIEETIGTLSGHVDSAMPGDNPIYEEGENSNTSTLSHNTSSSSARQGGGTRQGSGLSQRSQRSNPDSGSHSEQSYIDRIRRDGQNFGEVLIILREAIALPIVVREALEELARLQLATEDYDTLADMAAPVVIADAIQTHFDVMQVQLWGCGAIWNMSGTERNQLAFVDAGALDGILAAMDKFIDHVDVQEKAIATLSNLAAAEDNLAVLVDKGAVGRIVEAMNKHSEVASIQARGCAAVTNLASHDSPLKQQIMELGGGGAVVIAMVMHPEDFYLQEKALRALRNLCANSEENKVELANIGGIDAAISAMQIHRDEAGVQEEGAWTLSNLAGNDDNKAVIGDCGGIDVIIRSMWVHSDNVSVQEWCTRALFTLTLDLHNGDVVLEVGGISAVVNAMQAHVDSPVVQEMGCAVLGNLAESIESKMRIVDEEALDAIVLAMVIHTDDMRVQERACMVLMRLAIPENVKSMQCANIPELALTAGDKFPERCEGPANRLMDLLH